MDKPRKVSTSLVMRSRYFQQGSNDKAEAGGNGCGSTIGERWGRSKKKKRAWWEGYFSSESRSWRGAALTTDVSRPSPFSENQFVLLSLYENIAVILYCAEVSCCLDGMETRVSV
jgi:hypothetical protein